MKRPTFPEEVREYIWDKYFSQCANWKHDKCITPTGLSIHHVIANTETNAKIYGDDFLQSKENGILLCDWCHRNYTLIEWLYEYKLKLINENKNTL